MISSFGIKNGVEKKAKSWLNFIVLIKKLFKINKLIDASSSKSWPDDVKSFYEKQPF